MHDGLGEQLLKVPFLAEPASKPARKQKAKPSSTKAAKKAKNIELKTVPAEDPAPPPTAAIDRPRGPRDLILARLSGVQLRHPANGEPGMDERGPFAKFRDNHVVLRVRGNLESLELRKTRYVVGDLTVIARRGQSGRRFLCVELLLPDDEADVRLNARFEQITPELPSACLASYRTPDESTGAVNIYGAEKAVTDVERMAA